MSLAATRLSLTHRATIRRATFAGDDWNGDGPATWADHLTDLPCRVWATAGRELVANADTPVVVEDLRMLVTLDTDVTDKDQIGAVTARGAPVLAGATIRAVLRNADHIELILVRAS